VSSPAILGILLEGSTEKGIPAVLVRLTLLGHELGLDGPQDIDGALVHVPEGVLGTLSRDVDLWLPDLADAVLQKAGGSSLSGLPSRSRSGLSHLSGLRHLPDLRDLGEVD
jgi:hypothetical protein